MTREELRDYIDQQRALNNIPYHVYSALIDGIDTLEQESKWIPVSERLPKAGEYVGDVAKYYLVQNEYGDMMVARYRHSEYWEQMYQLKPIADKIVAWCELPQPYEPQESEVKDADCD